MLNRSNPFATRFVRPGALSYRFSDTDDPQSRLVDMTMRLDQHRVGLIVGPHGSGKSTLLQTWLPQLNSHFAKTEHVPLCGQDRGRIDRWLQQRRIALRLQRIVARLPVGGLLIVDGAEQLGAWHFRRLRHHVRQGNRSLLATCHRPLAGAHVIHRTSVTASLLIELTQQLTCHEPHRVQRKVQQRLSQTTVRPDENVRELFFELYDLVHEFDIGPTTTGRPAVKSDHTASQLS